MSVRDRARRGDDLSRPGRRGSYAVEFALLLPVQIFLFMGMLDTSWVLFHLGVLDAAAHRGCRAGSLLDPGEFDERIEEVRAEVENRMTMFVEQTTGRPCDRCSAEAWTEGSPPTRRLRCEVGLEVEGLTGMVWGVTSLSSQQHAKLEWQREGGPS